MSSPPRSSSTCAAVVGLTCPNLLADGAATGTPAASMSRLANSCDGQRTPTVAVPADENQAGARARGTLMLTARARTPLLTRRRPSGSAHLNRRVPARPRASRRARSADPESGLSLTSKTRLHARFHLKRSRPGRRPSPSGNAQSPPLRSTPPARSIPSGVGGRTRATRFVVIAPARGMSRRSAIITRALLCGAIVALCCCSLQRCESTRGDSRSGCGCSEARCSAAGQRFSGVAQSYCSLANESLAVV